MILSSSVQFLLSRVRSIVIETTRTGDVSDGPRLIAKEREIQKYSHSMCMFVWMLAVRMV